MDSGKDAGTGLAWGRWQGGQATQTYNYLGVDASGKLGIGATNSAGAFIIGNSFTYTSDLGAASIHWMTGQEVYPRYLAQVLTGTATYTLLGGTQPTDSLGNVGTLNKATLAANFTAQTVNAGVDFSIGGNNWFLLGNGLPLNGGTNFNAYSCTGGCTTTPVSTPDKTSTPLSTFSRNGSPVSDPTVFYYANLSGQLLGTGLNSAALSYSVMDTSTSAINYIQGIAGFSGPTQNTATPYRIVGIEDGLGGSFNNYYYAGASSYYGPISSYYAMGANAGTIYPTEAPVSRVVDSPAGLTEFVGAAYYLPTTASASSTPTYADATTIRIGTAVNKDVGSTTIGGIPVSWGRWEGGSVNIYTLDGSSKLGTIANADKSIHWIASGALTGPTRGSLPLTGTATYTLVGNTNPTDFKGNVGTLGSATLNADFSKMLVNTSVAASFNSATNTSTWSMTANNVPFNKKGEFSADSSVNGTNGITQTATCTGASCGSQTYGAINGGFIGTAAAGGVLSYRMATGSTTAATATIPASFVPTNGVVGLAVFRK